jgi:predicted aconitase with swiveling domain
MTTEFKGRVVVGGSCQGEALVSPVAFNALASFYQPMLQGSDRAVCSDQGNKYLYGKDLKGKIICLPTTVGSTSAGTTWDRVADMDIAPKAMLFSNRIDSLAAAGVIIAHVWTDNRIVAIDQLGQAFLDHVNNGDSIEVDEDGTVRVS